MVVISLTYFYLFINYNKCELINIGYGLDISIKELAMSIKKISNLLN